VLGLEVVVATFDVAEKAAVEEHSATVNRDVNGAMVEVVI